MSDPAPSPFTAPSTFGALGLSAPSLGALAEQRYLQPTPIQARAIPLALSGTDVIGCAATGTGKTAAFVLPLVERLAGKLGTHGLVLAPTRELVLQIAECLHAFGKPRGVTSATVIGGAGMDAQRRALAAHPTVIVATPGRLVDLLQQRAADLGGVEILVLDEADRMLDMGFKPQLDRILPRVPRQRQTLLFSATMGGEVRAFAQAAMRTPTTVEVARSGTTAARADQRVFRVPQEAKLALLLALLAEGKDSTLVFTRTKRRADRVARALERAGHDAARIHADRSQGQRVAALEGFRSGKHRVLVATDIAARGLDVENIGHVVLFDLPHVPEDYVHRVGRTARASASGRASSFASSDELPLLRAIERLLGKPIAVTPLPESSPIYQAELARRTEAPPPHGPRHPPSRAQSARHEPRAPARPAAPRTSSGPAAEPSGPPRLVASFRPRRRR